MTKNTTFRLADGVHTPVCDVICTTKPNQAIPYATITTTINNKDLDAEWSNNEDEEHNDWSPPTPPPVTIIIDTYGATLLKFVSYINDQEYEKDSHISRTRSCEQSNPPTT